MNKFIFSILIDPGLTWRSGGNDVFKCFTNTHEIQYLNLKKNYIQYPNNALK